MAVFLFLLALVGGAVVGDLVLENTTAGSLTVLNQPLTGHTQGTLLALVAGLGLVVGLLLVAAVGATKTRRARRKQLRSIRVGIDHHVAQPEGKHAGPAAALFSSQKTDGKLGEPASPADLGGERWADRPDGRRVAPELTNHRPRPRQDHTSGTIHRRGDPDPWFGP
jgi:hypothetical protein